MNKEKTFFHVDVEQAETRGWQHMGDIIVE